MTIRFAHWAAAAAAVGLATTASNAALLTFNTFGNTGTETTEPSTSAGAGISASTFTVGAGITPAGNGNRFGGSGWFDTGNTAAGNTIAEAVAGNDYLEFTITPLPGGSYTATDLTYLFDVSGTGPKSLTLRSSIDGFAADLATASATAGITVFTTLDFPDIVNRTAATTFRVYGIGATLTTGTGGFDTNVTQDNIILNGTSVPEPTSLAVLPLAGLLAVRRRRAK